LVKRIVIINKENTVFTIRNRVFRELKGDVDTSPIKRKALALIANSDDPKKYTAKLGKSVLYIQYIKEKK